MSDIEHLLEELGRDAPHDPDLAGTVRRRARRQLAVGATVAAVLVLGAGTGLVAATRDPGGGPPAAAGGATFACTTPQRGVLPEWARTGFSDPRPVMPFVTGDQGRIVAILFNDLVSPPRPGEGNKILWVVRDDASGGFSFVARLSGTGTVVRREVGPAPGPSGIDLPAPGCWHFDLSWGGGRYTDTMTLTYSSP